MRSRLLRPIVLGAILIGSLALASCRSDVTPIRSLLDDPSRYDGQTVRIAGEAKESVAVMGYGAYRIDDGTGMLLVLSKEGGAPRSGARVGVEGEFKALYTVGDRSEAVLLEDHRFDAPES